MNDCEDVCSDRAFLFKLIELVLLLVAWWGVSDMSLDLEYRFFYVRVWAAAGGLTLVLILITIYLFDESHFLTEVIFLCIYGLLLVFSGATMVFAVRGGWFLRGLLGGILTLAAGLVMLGDAALLIINN